jgi:hypothetical protein
VGQVGALADRVRPVVPDQRAAFLRPGAEKKEVRRGII